MVQGTVDPGRSTFFPIRRGEQRRRGKKRVYFLECFAEGREFVGGGRGCCCARQGLAELPSFVARIWGCLLATFLRPSSLFFCYCFCEVYLGMPDVRNTIIAWLALGTLRRLLLPMYRVSLVGYRGMKWHCCELSKESKS